ncbi:MAG TPA: DinB family protein [Candidatus Acidoferrales bacterium]|nr:DinB family protein [Candidatus Acidoferrales bacterium]
MARVELGREDVLAMLAEHPRRIAAATAVVPASRLKKERILGEWTAVDILAHLRCCADARGEFIPRILAERRPTLRAIDPRTLFRDTAYRDLEFSDSLRAFTRQRARLLKLLRSLPSRDWERTAIVTGGGLSRERTVLFYAAWLARHEPAHVRHVERLVSHTR